MIPVFLCHVPAGDLRRAFFQATMARWREEPGSKLIVLAPTLLNCSPYDFQKKRRIEAEAIATAQYPDTDFYVLADDDCLPESPEPFLDKAAEMMALYPQFAVLAGWPTNSEPVPWTPDWPEYGPAVSDENVMEHVSVGGIRFRRKIPDFEWPDQLAKTYDSQEAEGFRKLGLRSGFLRNIRYNHLGRNYSTVWP